MTHIPGDIAISASLVLLHLLGAAALLLWGLRMVRTGIMRGYGATLRQRLTAALGNRLAAFLAGFGITLALQSSTATTLMTASLAARGLVRDATALAIVLGADLGTSLVAQVLSFDISLLSPVLVLAGAVGFFFGQATRLQDLSRALIGLGLMLLALTQITAAAQPVRDSAAVQMLLAGLGEEPLLAVLIAAALTLLCSSSLAVILLTMSLAAQRAVGGELALMMVIGANLGGAALPLVANAAAEAAARRAPLANLACRAVAAGIALALLPAITRELAALDPQPARLVANFHTAFNLALALAFLPLTGPLAALARRLMPDRPAPADEGRPRYLDPEAIETPSVAIASAARETLRQGDVVAAMLRQSLEVFRTDDRKLLKEVEAMDDTVDSLHEAIKLFLTRVSRESLDEQDSRRCIDVLTFTTNLEHAGDIIDKNLMEIAAKKIKHNLKFSDQGFAEIVEIHKRVMDNLALALNVFVSGDTRLARQLLEEKVRFRELERAAAEAHIARLASGQPETLATSGLHLDVVRDLKRINSHFTSVAYPILDAAGVLAPTRLRREAS